MDRTVNRTVTLQIGAAFAALMLVSGLVWQVSSAAFSDTTSTTAPEWGSATVSLTDDDGTAEATFTAQSTMVPGDSDQACITVNYGGDVASQVKLYGSTTFNSATDLGQYLDLVIEEVSGINATDGSCADPNGSLGTETVTAIYTGTLSVNASSFTVLHKAWDTGLVSNWAPSAAGSQIYRITATLQDNNAAQSLDTTATFTWEAQNTTA